MPPTCSIARSTARRLQPDHVGLATFHLIGRLCGDALATLHLAVYALALRGAAGVIPSPAAAAELVGIGRQLLIVEHVARELTRDRTGRERDAATDQVGEHRVRAPVLECRAGNAGRRGVATRIGLAPAPATTSCSPTSWTIASLAPDAILMISRISWPCRQPTIVELEPGAVDEHAICRCHHRAHHSRQRSS